MSGLFVSDCEGPISKNDNAFELAANFIPNGDRLFANISRYDDVLADVFRRPGYCAGSTLKLVLPFFKAYGVSDEQMYEFSSQNIFLIENSRSTLKYVQSFADAFIVSTSYEHYIRALCRAVDFPYKNTYCTKVCLDKAPTTSKEKERLRVVAKEIARMPLIEVPVGAKRLEDFSEVDQVSIGWLDDFFWRDLPGMFVGKYLLGVVAVGGEQKALSIRDAAGRLGADLSSVLYVGDSITDVEALRLVREKGGLSVSFNGNGYAVGSAEVAVLSESNLVLAVIADLFCRLGKEETLKVLGSWSFKTLEDSGVNYVLLGFFVRCCCGILPKVQIVSSQNMESLTVESCEFRKKVRGVSVGGLG